MPRTSTPLLAILLALLAAPVFLHAQSLTPAPNPPAAAAAPTIQANVRLIVVDVVVTGKNQQPVPNLKPADFTILENNVPQIIKTLEEHRSPTPADLASLPPVPRLPAGFFTNYTPTPPGALNILLLDALNTPLKDQAFVHAQLLDYLKNSTPGAPIAIFALNQRLVMLQGFTSDPDLLKSVIDHKASPHSSVKLDDPLAGNGNPNSAADALNAIGADDIGVLIANLKQAEAIQQTVQIQQRTGITLDAMNALAHYLSAFPGRKNLIWFSGSFPLSILPDISLKNPFAATANDSDDEFRETSNLLAAARVAVYPIDARGLVNTAAQSAADDGAKNAGIRGVISQQNKDNRENQEEHGTMIQMADLTGGHTFVDTNGLAEAVAKAVGQGSSYYTLTYSPTDSKDDGSFRKIQLKLKQQGLHLEYRRGYYSAKPGPSTSEAVSLFTSTPPPTRSMDLAMVHGAPTPAEIMVKARVLPSATVSENSLALGNSPNTKLTHPVKGPYRRYLIDIAADPHDLSLTRGSEGKFTGTLQLMTFVYNPDALLISTVAKSINFDLTLDAARQLFQHGLQLHQEVSVPDKGDYYLRIGLHDMTSNRIGAIEVPVASVKTLPPALVIAPK